MISFRRATVEYLKIFANQRKMFCYEQYIDAIDSAAVLSVLPEWENRITSTYWTSGHLWIKRVILFCDSISDGWVQRWKLKFPFNMSSWNGRLRLNSVRSASINILTESILTTMSSVKNQLRHIGQCLIFILLIFPSNLSEFITRFAFIAELQLFNQFPFVHLQPSAIEFAEDNASPPIL